MSVPPCRFWNPATFDATALPAFVPDAYDAVLPYIRTFLGATHPYRNGVICPFLPTALEEDTIFFTWCDPGDAEDDGAALVEECIRFFDTARSQHQFGALIVLLPDSFSVPLLDRIQRRNHPDCVRASLMIGILHPENLNSSIHSLEFMPLRTPSPVLVLRDMCASDLMFIEPETFPIRQRIDFLKGFIQRFGDEDAPGTVETQIDYARALLQQYARETDRIRKKRIGISLLILASVMAGLAVAD